jgi:predicted RNA-binding protein YlxR (DUF448 family)
MRIPHNEPLETDIVDGRTAKETSPERRCILTGSHGPRDELIRLALSPDGTIAPDPLARAPGRGAWIAVSRAELEKAMANGKLKGALARAFKGAPAVIPADLGERTEAALLRTLLDRLGLERAAGNVTLGTEKIAQAARSGAVAALYHACDAGDDGSRKLSQAWRVGEEAEGTGMAGTILPLDRATLSVALGRDNVVHLALTDSAAAQRVAAPLQRLVRFLGRDEQTGNDSRAGRESASPGVNDVFDEGRVV